MHRYAYTAKEEIGLPGFVYPSRSSSIEEDSQPFQALMKAITSSVELLIVSDLNLPYIN